MIVFARRGERLRNDCARKGFALREGDLRAGFNQGSLQTVTGASGGIVAQRARISAQRHADIRARLGSAVRSAGYRC